MQWRRVRAVGDAQDHRLIQSAETPSRWSDWFVELWRKPSADKLARREYEDARRNLLEFQRMREYYENMVKFETQRIRRLKDMLNIHS